MTNMQTASSAEIALVIDCLDLNRCGDFWASALGYRRAGDIFEPYLSLLPEDGGQGPEVLLQRVPEAKRGKNRLHLDLRTRDLAAEVERLRKIGAQTLTTNPHDESGWTWHVLADPEGNEFCVVLQR